MEKIIVLKDKEKRIAIGKAFKVSPMAISYSLNFINNGERNKKIRAMAFQNGGRLYKLDRDAQMKDFVEL